MKTLAYPQVETVSSGMTLLRNVLIAAALGAGMVAFGVWQYNETGGPEAQRQLEERRVERAEVAEQRTLNTMAVVHCREATEEFLRNPRTVDWASWHFKHYHLGDGVWSHRLPLTSMNDLGVRKSLTAHCTTVGDAIISFELK